MIVYNPTEFTLDVSIEGITYVVGPKSKIAGVKPEHAEYWIKNLHQFITLEAESKSAPKVEVAEVTEPVEKPAAKTATKK